MTSSFPTRKGNGPRFGSLNTPALAAVPATEVPDEVDPVEGDSPAATTPVVSPGPAKAAGPATVGEGRGSALVVPPRPKPTKAGASRKVEPAVDEAEVGIVERVTVRMPQDLFDDLMAGMARTFGNHPRAARRARIRTGLNAYAVAALRAGIVVLDGLSEDAIVDMLRQDSEKP